MQNLPDIKTLRQGRFYDKVRRKIAQYSGRHANIIMLAPDLFMLLCRLLKDSRVPLSLKGIVAAAVAYFISPLDLMPEAILGPFGFLDDIIVTVMVLNKIINEVSEEVVVENWSGELNILATVQNVLSISSTLIGKRLNLIRRKVGL